MLTKFIYPKKITRTKNVVLTILFILESTSCRTIFAEFLSLVTSLNTFVNSILAVSASRNHRDGSSIAKSAKSTLAFTIKDFVIFSKVILASFATFSEASDIFFTSSVTGNGHGDEAGENNGLKTTKFGKSLKGIMR